MSTPEWAAEELRLWNKLMYTRYEVSGTRRNDRIIKAAKAKGLDVKAIERSMHLHTEAQVVSRTWAHYDDFINHL